MDRDRRACLLFVVDEGHPAALQRSPTNSTWRRPRTPTMPSRNHAVVLVSRAAVADVACARVRQGDPSAHDRSSHDQRRRSRGAGTAGASGRRAASTSRSCCWIRRIARSRVRSSTTSRARRGQSPRDVVTVFIPEYVVGHWWEQLLHNQSALRLKARLLFKPGVMVTSVPWQLRSSARVHRQPRAEVTVLGLTGPRPSRLRRS